MPGRILVFDTTPINRVTYKMTLTRAFFDVKTVADSQEAKAAIRQFRPHLILLAARLDGQSGYALCAELKSRPSLDDCPVFVIERDQEVDWAEAFAAGLEDVITGSLDDPYVLDRLRQTYRREAELRALNEQLSCDQDLGLLGLAEDGEMFLRRKQNPKILWASATTAPDPLPQQISERLGFAIEEISPQQPVLDAQTPDLLIMSGHGQHFHKLLHDATALRKRVHHDGLPILVLLEGPLDVPTRLAFEAGVSDVVATEIGVDHIALRIKALLSAEAKSARSRRLLENRLKEALTDPLSGLFNRRYAENYLNRCQSEYEASETPHVALLIDIDRFKDINDTFGHSAGDDVIRDIGRILKSQTRSSDLVARMGGEEFLILLKNETLENALPIAERIRQKIYSSAFPACPNENISISVGIASMRQAQGRMSDLLLKADEALYQCKSTGRNRVEIYRDIAA